MSMPGTILSQEPKSTTASRRWACTMVSTELADEIPRGQNIAHAFVPVRTPRRSRRAPRTRPGVPLACVDALLHFFANLAQVQMAGHDMVFQELATPIKGRSRS
jgi:hypothetical protein